ncbi:TlpA family protein disulfide reductase [Zunongwangia atlantica]|uniref:Thioredoxin domain-containing protein n=1 Tax=Zunongwangia atlantica 22II14-10F7 TaxID=1185767 RepID=A0A1Y1T4K4_9FLAO|nr:thioredoxin-like domain-containing protein [Zunongwangia atlantica]ORL45979.1 hypothetical protein IIF7_07661 [Zunongwangia atlantica 22II14-10F7]
MSFKKYHYLIALIIFISISCKNSDKNLAESASVEEEPIPTLQYTPIDTINAKAILIGKTDSPYNFKYFNLLVHTGLSNEISNIEKENHGDSLYVEIQKLDKPQIIDLIAFEEGGLPPLFSRFYITPGDRIFMEIKNHKIRFSGENAAHYNFFQELNDPLHEKWGIFEGNFDQYKNDNTKFYNQKKKILENYTKAHPEVSEDFKQQTYAALKYEYLFHLITPRDHQLSNGTYQGSELDQVINKMQFDGEIAMFDAQEYFDTINFEDDFNRPELIYNDYFKRSLSKYIHSVFANAEVPGYSIDNFINERDFIKSNLDNELENFAIAKLIYNYHEAGLAFGQKGKALIEDLINDYREDFSKKEDYVSKVNEIIFDLNSMDFKFNAELLDEKLINIKGDSIKLRDIFKNDPSKFKLIDNWASWCGPCIAEMQKSDEYNPMLKENDISSVYISVDEDLEKWEETVNQLENYTNKEQHYRFADFKKSNLARVFLQLGKTKYRYSIPKYTVIKNDSIILSTNSPQPSKQEEFISLLD